MPAARSFAWLTCLLHWLVASVQTAQTRPRILMLTQASGNAQHWAQYVYCLDMRFISASLCAALTPSRRDWGTPDYRHPLWLNSLYAAQHGHTFKVDTGDTVRPSRDGDARWAKVRPTLTQRRWCST